MAVLRAGWPCAGGGAARRLVGAQQWLRAACGSSPRRVVSTARARRPWARALPWGRNRCRPPLCALCAPAAPPGRWSFPPTFRAIDSLRPTDRRRSVRRRPQRHPGNFPPLGLGRGVEGSRFRGGAQRPLGTAREQSPNAGAEKRRQNTLPALMRNPVHKNNNGKNNTQRQGFKNQKVMPDIMDRPMASVSVGLWSLC